MTGSRVRALARSQQNNLSAIDTFVCVRACERACVRVRQRVLCVVNPKNIRAHIFVLVVVVAVLPVVVRRFGFGESDRRRRRHRLTD